MTADQASSAERRQHVSQVARQLHAELAFREVTRCLAAAGIEHMLLKGPHLASTVYDKGWERDFSDLDVLVRPSSTVHAIAALRKGGFEPALYVHDDEREWAATYDRTFTAPNGWLVELHSAFAPDDLYAVDYDALFERAEPFAFGKQRAVGLCPEDLLLHLVIHAAKSHFRAIEQKHVEDVRRLVAAIELDWSRFEELAKEASCTAAAWIMMVAANVDGRVVSQDTLERFRPSRRREWWIRRWLTPERFPMLDHPEIQRDVMRSLLMPAMVDSWRPAFRAAGRLGARRLRKRARSRRRQASGIGPEQRTR